jgi:ornithine cyclodeaminase
MHNSDLLVISGPEVSSLLEGLESQLMRTVRRAYEIHGEGKSNLPHSTFLRLPDLRNRIIGLPAYLGAEVQVAGMKWVSSFPGNVEKGVDRASAVLILNSLVTGRPESVLEGSIISARRTAAGAGLAAQILHGSGEVESLGLIGCGLINFENARFITAAVPDIKFLTIYDLNESYAQQFAQRCHQFLNGIKVKFAKSTAEVFRSSTLIAFATTSLEPYILDTSECLPGATLLHVSLRDLSAKAILQCTNVVDDIDHVCREKTSVHLTEQLTGNRDFIRCTLSDVLRGRQTARENRDDVVVYSPFGLGVLDIAVGKLVCKLARERKIGMVVNSFFPESWLRDQKPLPPIILVKGAVVAPESTLPVLIR